MVVVLPLGPASVAGWPSARYVDVKSVLVTGSSRLVIRSNASRVLPTNP
jgi:hypothetical protein